MVWSFWEYWDCWGLWGFENVVVLFLCWVFDFWNCAICAGACVEEDGDGAEVSDVEWNEEMEVAAPLRSCVCMQFMALGEESIIIL